MSWSKSRILVSFTVLILIFSELLIINSVLSASSSSAPWVVRQPLPLGKGDATAAVVSNKLYVFGGYIQGANDVRSETYEYDPSSDTWTQKAAMPTPRWGCIAVEYNKKINVFAGYNRGYVWFDYFYKYPSNPLTTIPKCDAWGGVVHPDVIYFADGKDGYKYWMVYTPLPSSYENPCIVRSNDGIIWTDAGISNPVVPLGKPGNWNDLENPDPDFVYIQDYDKWFMVWVGGNAATDSRKIALAYSSDGKTWTQYDGTPVNGNLNPVILSGDDAAGQPWERSSGGISKVCTPTLFYENGIFYLYYAEEASGNNYGKAGFATFSWNNALNEIVNFERYSNNPTISLPMDNDFYAGCGHLDISTNNGIFYMYVVRGVLGTNSYELAWLSSSDKISWKYEGKALPRGTAGEWDDHHIYRSCPTVDPTGQVVKSDGKIKLYYSGWSEIPNIGIADIASNDHRANQVYDPATNTWEGKALVPDDVARQGLMGVLYNNQIHLFYDRYHYVYDPSTDSYTRKANVPTPRRWGTAAVVNNKIYVIGGYYWSGGASNVNEAYDPITDTWETKAPLPVPLYGTTRENPVINGKIYVTHGLDNSNFYSTNYVYDPSTDSWEQKSSAFYARDGVACGVIGNRLYVVGGRADFVGPYGLNYNEEYDPRRDGEVWSGWIERQPMLERRASATAAVCNDKLYVFGGYDQDEATSRPETFEYAPALNTWTQKANMPTARWGSVAVEYNGRIFVFGGQCDQRDFDVFGDQNVEPSTNNWAGDIELSKFLFNGTTGTYTGSISVYVSTVASYPNNKAITAIYDASLNIVVQSNERTGLTTGWQTFDLIGSFNLTQNAYYFLASHAPKGNFGRLGRGKGESAWKSRLYDGTLPTSLSSLSGQENAAYSIFCTYKPFPLPPPPDSPAINEAYIPATNTWETKANAPSDIGKAGLMGVLYNGEIHLFYQAYHYVYNPSTDSYARKADVPTPRTWGTAAVVNNKIYVIGGYSSGDPTNANEVYDPSSDTWITRAPLPKALYGSTRENPVISNKIYVTHGSDGVGFFATNYVYDPSTDVWEQRSSALNSRDRVAVGVVGNKLYVVGGRASLQGPYGLNTNEEYNPLLDGFARISVDTTPVKGEVFVNGTSWGIAPVSSQVNPGTYNISFGAVTGYQTPADQTIIALGNETVTVTGVYQPISTHDISVTSVTAFPTFTEVGNFVTVNVTVENNGDFDETIDIIGKYNGTIFDTKTGEYLAAKANSTVSLTWLTSTAGTFIISAEVPPVLGETNTGDNTYSDGMVSVSPKMHTLTVDSTPIKGIDFTINDTTHTTTWNGSLAEAFYTVTMPPTWKIETQIYNFKQWEDDSTNPIRTVSLTTDMTINATYELYLGTTGTIQGVVTDYDTGNPISGATVTADGLSNITFIDGRYSIEIPPGTYNVTASAAGYYSNTTTDVVVNLGEITILNFVLNPAPGSIEGRVIDTVTKAPLVGVVVIADPTYSNTTDIDGYYTIANVPNGTYTVRASLANYKDSVMYYVIVYRGEETTVNFALAPIMTWTQTSVSDFDSGTKYRVETTVINSSDGDVILQKSLAEDLILSDNFDDNILDPRWTVDTLLLVAQWVKIDLGSMYSVDTVYVYQSNFPNYYTKDYQIQLSTDDITYTTVASNTLLNSINDLKINTFTATNARFVKILITSCYPRISQGLNEIEVFQTGQPATNIALNKPTTASSEWPSPKYSASHAVDGLKGTTANGAPYPWLCADDAKAVSGNTLEEINGELKIQAFQHSYAHIERQLGLVSDPIWLNVTARIKVSGDVGRTWRPMIAVYWTPGDWCGIGISGNEFMTNLNVYSSQTEGFKSFPGAQPNVYIYVRIRLTLTSIQFSKSSDGASWTTLRTEARPASYSGPPSLLIVGKGYGNGGWDQFGYTYPNPDLDNSFPGNMGQWGTSYIDDVTVIQKGGEKYASSGNLTSTVYDASFIALWESINWTATTPPGTSIKLQTRTGNTPTPDETWSDWSNFYYASGEVITSPSGRYLQYRAVLQTNDPKVTPVLNDITIMYYAKT